MVLPAVSTTVAGDGLAAARSYVDSVGAAAGDRKRDRLNRANVEIERLAVYIADAGEQGRRPWRVGGGLQLSRQQPGDGRALLAILSAATLSVTCCQLNGPTLGGNVETMAESGRLVIHDLTLGEARTGEAGVCPGTRLIEILSMRWWTWTVVGGLLIPCDVAVIWATPTGPGVQIWGAVSESHVPAQTRPLVATVRTEVLLERKATGVVMVVPLLFCGVAVKV